MHSCTCTCMYFALWRPEDGEENIGEQRHQSHQNYVILYLIGESRIQNFDFNPALSD